MKRFETVVRFDETSNNINDYIKETLLNNGYFYDEINSEIIIVIGGDGTFLKAVHNNIDRLDEVSFYGIHTGTLGFFTDYKSDEVEEFVDDLINKKPILREYQLLKVKVDNNDVYYALNEMRIENVVRTQVLNVTLNGEEFETFRGTGMCVSTQIGSTAYNRSLKGAVIQDGLPLIQMSEIAGIHHSAYRSLGVPIVMSEDSKIVFESSCFEDAILCIDSCFYKLNGNHKKISVELGEKKIKFLRFKNVSYFKKLQTLF